VLGAALTVEGRLTGVIHVGTLQRREFADADARFLQLVADRLALAIERARLYERVVGHEGQLQMLVARLLATLEDERRRIAMTCMTVWRR
jgi:GAF domain-containing protein